MIINDNNTAAKKDTPLNKITYYEIKVITNKINTPDEYHGNKRKLKIFLI